MKRFLCLILVLIGSLAKADLGEDTRYFYENPSTSLSREQIKALNQFQVVFIGGYMNEVVRSRYFDINSQVLKSMGIDVTVFFPSSLQAAGVTQNELYKELVSLHEANPKPILLVGHSMGGLISVAATLAHPDLVTNGIVSEVVAMQSPLMANSLFEHQGLFGRMLSTTLRISSGHNSLYTSEIQKIIKEPLEKMDAQTRARLSRSVKFIASAMPLSEAATALKMAGAISQVSIPYDGLVVRNDMWIPGFGTVLGDLVVDHLEYVISDQNLIGSKFDALKIQAFTKSLFANLLASRNTRNSEYRELTQRMNANREEHKACKLFFGLF